MKIFQIGSILKNHIYAINIYKPKPIKYQRIAWIKTLKIGGIKFTWGVIKNENKRSR